MLGSVSFIQPILLSQVIYAAGPSEPNCTSGVLTGDSESNIAEITLSCLNLAKFTRTGATESSESIDLSRIRVDPVTTTATLLSATINLDQLVLRYRVNQAGGLFVRNIIIDAGTFSDNSDPNPITNSTIMVSSSFVIDQTIPYVENDIYSTGGGVLNVVAGGVLINDRDTGSVLQVNTHANPSNGALSLRSDGSFDYTPGPNFKGDSFIYTAVDEAGNISGSATVIIDFTAPTIEGKFYKVGDIKSGYVKVSDKVRVDFTASGPVTCISAVITGNSVDCHKIDNNHFYIYYVMQSTDKEGIFYYSATYTDLAGDSHTYSPPGDEIIFDKTPPTINLNGDSVMELEIHDTYEETATVYDKFSSDITQSVTGLVNTNKVGSYIIKYDAVDRAGNHETATRIVNVVDSVATGFAVISNNLRAIGLENNLDQVTTDNYDNFSGLYFEKSALINGVMKKIGRVTFKGTFNLSDSYLTEFINQLIDRMKAGAVGDIGIDFRGVSDLSPVFGRGATVKFYNLDKLGYANNSTADDVYSKISAFDDNGHTINKSSLMPKSAVYVGCSDKVIECYTFSIDVNHFSEYKIGKAPIKVDKPVEKNQLSLL